MANIVAEISISAPAKLNYLAIDEENNLHLLLPINSGQSIGLDNTCKHAEAVRDFYKVDGNKGAKFQLDEYKKQLDFEIDVLRKNARHNEEYNAPQKLDQIFALL